MTDGIAKKEELLLYDNGKDREYISVIFKDENFWLTQKAMAEDKHISHDDAVKNVGAIYEFRKKQDAEYISEFDREMTKYLKGGVPN